jgi:hypothetical protein
MGACDAKSRRADRRAPSRRAAPGRKRNWARAEAHRPHRGERPGARGHASTAGLPIPDARRRGKGRHPIPGRRARAPRQRRRRLVQPRGAPGNDTVGFRHEQLRAQRRRRKIETGATRGAAPVDALAHAFDARFANATVIRLDPLPVCVGVVPRAEAVQMVSAVEARNPERAKQRCACRSVCGTHRCVHGQFDSGAFCKVRAPRAFDVVGAIRTPRCEQGANRLFLRKNYRSVRQLLLCIAAPAVVRAVRRPLSSAAVSRTRRFDGAYPRVRQRSGTLAADAVLPLLRERNGYSDET